MARSLTGICNTSTEVIEIIDYLEKELISQGIFYERERLSQDRIWLQQVIIKNPKIEYLRVVKTKPEGGIFVRRRYNYDAFLVKRMARGSTTRRTWWLYIIPVQR